MSVWSSTRVCHPETDNNKRYFKCDDEQWQCMSLACVCVCARMCACVCVCACAHTCLCVCTRVYVYACVKAMLPLNTH